MNDSILDVTQALKDAENALRDFIAVVLEKEFGAEWHDQCGVTEDRVAKWRERKAAETRRQGGGGAVEPRLLYYADFYDLKTVLGKRWDKFSEALGDLKTMQVFLGELEKLRDPDAHRRELLPHQKHLAIGISGEIRTRIVRYRSKLETPEDYFPKIESVRDSLGNVWTPKGSLLLSAATTQQVLRPGDTVEFVVTAIDPMGSPLKYRLWAGPLDIREWQDGNTLSLTVTDKHIAKTFVARLEVKSVRDYHAWQAMDDHVEFLYSVLPRSP